MILEDDVFKNKLIEFMKLKASFLPPPFNRTYFTNQDAINFYVKIPNDYSFKIFKDLCYRLWCRHSSDSGFCIFCIYHLIIKNRTCRSCMYGKKHRPCNSDYSDYKKLISHLLINKNHGTISSFVSSKMDSKDMLKFLEEGIDNEEIRSIFYLFKPF